MKYSGGIVGRASTPSSSMQSVRSGGTSSASAVRIVSQPLKAKQDVERASAASVRFIEFLLLQRDPLVMALNPPGAFLVCLGCRLARLLLEPAAGLDPLGVGRLDAVAIGVVAKPPHPAGEDQQDRAVSDQRREALADDPGEQSDDEAHANLPPERDPAPGPEVP